MNYQYRPRSKAEEMRGIIVSLLDASDKTQVIDYPLTEEKKEEWRKYRQKLRELYHSDFAEDITLPTPPQD